MTEDPRAKRSEQFADWAVKCLSAASNADELAKAITSIIAEAAREISRD